MINQTSFMQTTDKVYPYLKVERDDVALPIPLKQIPKGDCPIVVTYSGKEVMIWSTNLDPVSLRLLLEMYPCTLYVTAEEVYGNIKARQLLDIKSIWKEPAEMEVL